MFMAGHAAVQRGNVTPAGWGEALGWVRRGRWSTAVNIGTSETLGALL